MAAGGFKEFVAGETLDEDEINDYLMQGVLVFAGTAARGSAITSPVEGQFAFLKDDDALTFYDGSQWTELSTEPGAAVVGSTTGSPTTNTTGGYSYYGFKSSGSITFSDAGFCEVLLIAGGGGGGDGAGSDPAGGGGAGGVFLLPDVYVQADTAYTVTVGAGGARGSSSNQGSNGGESLIVDLTGQAVGGGGGAGSVDDRYPQRGASGGGGGFANLRGALGITGQGFAGGTVNTVGGAGGGGAGGNAPDNNGADPGSAGGVGVNTYSTWGVAVTAGELISSVRWFGGGGGGAGRAGSGGAGGDGGGGDGAIDSASAGDGLANSGGGGGGSELGLAGNGGSGIVIVRVAV